MRRDAGGRVAGRTRLAIDLSGALGLTGTMIGYLSLSSLVPAAVAVGYGEPVWPFLAAGGLTGAVGLGLHAFGRRSPGPIGFREGYLVVSLTWLLAAMYAALPYLFSDDPQLSRPVDALFEGMAAVPSAYESETRRKISPVSPSTTGVSPSAALATMPRAT